MWRTSRILNSPTGKYLTKWSQAVHVQDHNNVPIGRPQISTNNVVASVKAQSYSQLTTAAASQTLYVTLDELGKYSPWIDFNCGSKLWLAVPDGLLPARRGLSFRIVS